MPMLRMKACILLLASPVWPHDGIKTVILPLLLINDTTEIAASNYMMINK
jgi:hypothetical protein